MDPKTLEEIRARHEATSRGPWWWSGYRSTRHVDLMGGRGDEVMGFKRYGAQGAQPVFCTKGLLYTAHELTEGTDPGSGGRDRITEIPHPDARFIAASWQDVADLLAEVDRLRAYEIAAGKMLEAMTEEEGEGCECGGATEAQPEHDSTCVLRFLPKNLPSQE